VVGIELETQMPIVALNNDEHRDLRVKKAESFEYVSDAHMLPVVAHECANIAADCPVVFVKNEDTGQFQMVAILGLEAGENLFVKDGSWRAMYIPAVLRNHPFKAIADAANPEHVTVGLDTESEFVTTDAGESLFTEDGSESEFLKARKSDLAAYLEQEHITRGIVSFLADKELLAQRSLSVNIDGEEVNIGGLYSVNEVKMNELPDDEFSEIRRRGLLPLIYAHLISLNQIRRLVGYRGGA
jgi:hypothetical protein